MPDDGARDLGGKLDDRVAAAANAADRLARVRTEYQRRARHIDRRDAEAVEALRVLQDDIATAEKNLIAAREELKRGRADLREALDSVGRRANPEKEINRLAGDTPLLLMPLRLETRFKDDELWVRVYPDDWAVDVFEEQLADVEVQSATRFWAGFWRAGGDEDLRRTAWRDLVASHGSGRAGWITRQLTPDNVGDEPVRGGADEVIIVVVGAGALADTVRAPAAVYWEMVWRAGDDPDALATAREKLIQAVGEDAAADVSEVPPANLDELVPQGTNRADVKVTVAFCELPEISESDTKVTSWTRAARATVLPDRIVLLGYAGGNEVLREVGRAIPPSLVVGPDPSAVPEDQLRIDDGELVVPDELLWMFDFDEAIAAGMGFRIDLDGATRGGFDRLIAVGVRTTATPEESQTELETLLGHHHHSSKGFALLPQGAPTNNTEGARAGYDRLDDADASYDLWFGTPGLKDLPVWADKQDGQWLAECLGIDPATFATVAGASGTDQAEARAMNVAVWPATWGYFLETMMHPLLDGAQVDAVRAFFTRYVSGRGRVPAIRIGRQPYGIMPTTALSRLRFGKRRDRDEDVETAMLGSLNALLARVADQWAPLGAAAPHVGGAGDPHQTLLDVIAQHPASVEFHQRYAESIEDIFNRFSLVGFGVGFFTIWQAIGAMAAGRQLLADLGYTGGDDPDILGKLFHGAQHKLKGPVIDDRPLSEDDPVREYTDDHRNYLQWLADTARTSLDALRREQGFTGDTPPTALLYLLLRHALLLSWWDAGLRVRVEAGLLDDDAVRLARNEPAFVHVGSGPVSESRWASLYEIEPRVTGDDRMTIADVLPSLFGSRPTRYLDDVTDAIARLAGLPTARLERLLAEHLDCCSHRLDAWRLGLVTHRLLEMRLAEDERGRPTDRRGIHLGAYGWVEDVRRERRVLDYAEVPKRLAETFADPADPPLMRDSSNGGFVHAPSLDHAATAAVLRSGFIANATASHPDTMAVNLSSERVRLAQSLMQGVRNGQPLGALLGYRLERGLHDRHGLVEVDRFIHDLRAVFPAAGDRDGRQAIDGLDLIRHIETSGITTYPFARPDLPPASLAEAAAINAEVVRLLDMHDALADLALAEGVHQAVLGNFDRVSANLDAFGQGGFPPDPGVVETPRSGTTLTHRFGLHLRSGLDHTHSPVAGVAMTPRAQAEPAVNELLASLLPAPANVVTSVAWEDADGTTHGRLVSQANLGLQPLDLLYLLRLESEAAVSELDERIVRVVEEDETLRPDVTPRVLLSERVAGSVTFFELAPLVAHLRAVLTRSRPLRASDVMPPGEATTAADAGSRRVNRDRAAAVLAALEAERATAVARATSLATNLTDATANRAALVAGIDQAVDRTIDVLRTMGTFGIGGSGWGELSERRRALFTDLSAAVDEVIGRWEAKQAEAAGMLARDDALPSTATAEERARVLLLAEHAVSTAVTTPVPTDGDAFRAEVDAKHLAFVTRLAALRAVGSGAADLAGLMAAVAVELPLDAFDATPLDLAPFEDRIIELCRYALGRIASVIAAADDRIARATQLLADHDTTTSPDARVDVLVDATHALLGDDALVVPEFSLSTSQGDEWDAALSWSRTGGLAAHLSARDFPVDDWLHGVARVREKVRHWEQLTILASVLGRPEPDVRPIQLPHASEPWLALELPDAFSITGERLMYTAHYPVAFASSAAQCGLLVDEWTEVIPGDSETTGIAFHYDRPSSEPPQVMLLVVPPQPREQWRWDDVVDALHETLDMARVRAIEPDQVATTPYAAFLPATVTAATLRGISISMNLALNNDVLRYMRGDDG